MARKSKKTRKKSASRGKNENTETRRALDDVKDAFKKANWCLALRELALFVLMFGTLEACNQNASKHPVFYYAFIVYYAALLILISAFIIVNRGFSFELPTQDQLSDSMSEKEKTEFIEMLKRAHEKGKKLLIYLIPLLFCVMIDFVLTMLPF